MNYIIQFKVYNQNGHFLLNIKIIKLFYENIITT